MRYLIDDTTIDYLNVWYDALTKHQDAGGITGIRKLNKILDIFDLVATLSPSQILCQSCGVELGQGMDLYSLNPSDTPLCIQLENDHIDLIKAGFDKVKWSIQHSRKIDKALHFLEASDTLVIPINQKLNGNQSGVSQ